MEDGQVPPELKYRHTHSHAANTDTFSGRNSGGRKRRLTCAWPWYIMRGVARRSGGLVEQLRQEKCSYVQNVSELLEE